MQANNYKILIIDDTPSVIDFIRDSLLKEGFHVFVAISGEKALSVVEHIKPDLILLDILMPGLNGYETCTFLKNNNQTTDIPVVFMSALTETTDKVKGFQAGAIDYLTKPLNNKELLIRVNAHLSLVARVKLEKQHLKRVNNAIIKSLGEIVYNYDTVNDEIVWSETVVDILDYSPEQLGTNLKQFLTKVHPNHRNGLELEMNDAIEMGINVNFDFQLCTKGNTYLWFQNRGTVIVNKEGKSVNIVGVLLNMSGRKKQEKRNKKT